MQVCIKNAVILVSVWSESLDYQIMATLQSGLSGLSGTHGGGGDATQGPPLNAGNRRAKAGKSAGDGGSNVLWVPCTLALLRPGHLRELSVCPASLQAAQVSTFPLQFSNVWRR